MSANYQERFTGLSDDFIQKNSKYIKLLQGFRLLDDDFMSKVFEDKECAQLLLHIILDRTDLSVQDVHGQRSIKNLQGRSIRLDILAIDQEGRPYNIEIQRRDEGADAHRARYNSSLLDANLTSPGDHYTDLLESYVIFITERDVLKAGLPIYHIDRMIQETGTPFGDGSHIIYVNAQHKNDTPLGRLMHDFSCTQAKDMHYPILAERVRYFKENMEGATTMCREVEKLVISERNEGRAEGRAEGRLEERAASVRAVMATLHLTIDEAMDLLKTSEADKSAVRKAIEG
jgi:predicted transposase/invertase (TIGR01784 family)